MEVELFFGFATGYGVLVICSVIGLVSVNTKNYKKTSFLAYHLVSWVQFIKWVVLINVSTNESVNLFFKSLIWVFYPELVKGISSATGMPERFLQVGVKGAYFMQNSLVYLIVFGFFSGVYLYLAFSKSKKIEKVKKIACNSLVIRLVLLIYFEFCLFTALQLNGFEMSTTFGITSSVVSCIILAGLLVFFIFIAFYVQRKVSGGNEAALCRISTVVEEFKDSSKKYQYYYTIFLTERISASIVYVFLQDYPFLQFLILEIMTVLKSKSYLVLYVFILKPFQIVYQNYFVLFLDMISVFIILFVGSFLLWTVKETSPSSFVWFIFFLIIIVFCVTSFILVHSLKEVNQIENMENETNSKIAITEEKNNTKEFNQKKLNKTNFEEVKIDKAKDRKVKLSSYLNNIVVRKKKNESFKDPTEDFRDDIVHNPAVKLEVKKGKNFIADDEEVRYNYNENKNEGKIADREKRIGFYGSLVDKYKNRINE